MSDNKNKFLEFEAKVYDKVNAEIRRRIKKNEYNYKIASNFVNRRTFYLRPTLIVIAARLFGGSEKAALLPAVAMQLSNEWMLIHDDIEDKSEYRRKKLALHKIYGEELALNCGDYLHAEAWSALTDYVLRHGASKGGRMYRKFYDIINTTIGAQTLDLKFSYSVRDFSKVDEKVYYKIANGKGAYYSVYGPLQMGAIVANQPEIVLKMLKDIGSPAGIAAQIQNDILDIEEGNVSNRGYQDLYEGKLTLISLHIFNKANTSERARIRSIYAKNRQDKSELDIEFLLEMIKKHKGLEYAAQKRDAFGRIADKMFTKYEKQLPNNKFKEILRSAITSQYKAYQHT
ncbi:MAG: polyprenyl synthetase family protein [Candidatus Micrarchaeaceae archaeon]